MSSSGAAQHQRCWRRELGPRTRALRTGRNAARLRLFTARSPGRSSPSSRHNFNTVFFFFFLRLKASPLASARRTPPAKRGPAAPQSRSRRPRAPSPPFFYPALSCGIGSSSRPFPSRSPAGAVFPKKKPEPSSAGRRWQLGDNGSCRGPNNSGGFSLGSPTLGGAGAGSRGAAAPRRSSGGRRRLPGATAL